MQFKHLTDQEMADLRKILDEGIYSFKILSLKAGKSKNNNWKIDLKTEVIHFGKIYTQYDSLVFTDNMMWKIKHFCESVGHLEWYEHGNIPESQLIGQRGYFSIVHETDNKGEKRAKVKDYIVQDNIQEEFQEVDPKNIPEIPWTDDELPKEF